MMSLNVVVSNSCWPAVLAGVVDDSLVARRSRESVYPMISVDDAVHTVLAEADVMDVENVRLTGRICFYHLQICK